MFRGRLLLVLAAVLSSTDLVAQNENPSSTEKHSIVVETDSGRYGAGAAKYGPVLECRDGKSLNVVKTGTKCDTDDDGKDYIELKASTEQKQHIVGVTSVAQGTEFGLVYLEQTTRSKR